MSRSGCRSFARRWITARRWRSRARAAPGPIVSTRPSTSRSRLPVARWRDVAGAQATGSAFSARPGCHQDARRDDCAAARRHDGGDRRRPRCVDRAVDRAFGASPRDRSGRTARARSCPRPSRIASGSPCIAPTRSISTSRLVASAPHTLRVVGNLPYNISTPLLFRLLGFRSLIKDMHLMLQREVVERMTATPGGKEYGRLTVMLALWASAEACFHIGPGAFVPAAARLVDVRARRAEARRRTSSWPTRPRSRAMVAHLFSMRRKTLGRSLKGRLTGAQIESVGIDPIARPETLAPADFARLASLAGLP